jgi:hypothetical protein
MRLFPMIICLVLAAPAALAPAAWADTALADPADDKALAAFKDGFGEACPSAFNEDGSPILPPERFDLNLPGGDGYPPSTLMLWQFICDIAAYNAQSVWFAQDEWALAPLAFAEPDLRVNYTIADDVDSGLKDVSIVGWRASNMLSNSAFDPATMTMTAGALWRGIGDASDSGVWRLVEGRFILIRYEADASYDGEINPTVILDIGQ